jgi:hypothetical protein
MISAFAGFAGAAPSGLPAASPPCSAISPALSTLQVARAPWPNWAREVMLARPECGWRGVRIPVLRVGIIALISYALLVGCMYLMQRNLLYQPDRGMASPGTYGLTMRGITLTAADGVRVTAWYATPDQSMPLVVYFHGNGGHLGYRRELFTALLNAGYGLMAVSYRGFGSSEGSPDDRGLYADGRAAIDYVKNQGFAEDRLVLYGESLGTGVATRMAAETNPRALVLESPFTSIADRAGELYWYLPVRLLLKDRFNNMAHIGAIEAGTRQLVHGILEGLQLVEDADHLASCGDRFLGHTCLR